MRNELFTLGIGFDQAESIAWHVFTHSIIARSSIPVAVVPIKRSHLKEIHDRPIDPKQSNEFSFTRFLLPYLCGYEGWSLFCDCDMLMRVDIKQLYELRDPKYAVQVVKHDYVPRQEIKYLGNKQYTYHRKNWSSVMLFNNEKCRRLTPAYVNTASGLQLHQFHWVDDDQIGGLPPDWNHLVGEYLPNPLAKNVHFTVGGPYFYEYEHVEFSDEWFKERMHTVHCHQRTPDK